MDPFSMRVLNVHSSVHLLCSLYLTSSKATYRLANEPRKANDGKLRILTASLSMQKLKVCSTKR